MSAIKQYRPMSNSLGSGQVLQSPYTHEKARLIVWDMTDLLVLDLVEKGLVTDQMVLDIGYDIENMQKSYRGADAKTAHPAPASVLCPAEVFGHGKS